MVPNSIYEDLAPPMAFFALIVNIVVVCLSIYLIFYFMALTANAVLDVGDALIPSREVKKIIEPTRWQPLTVAVISSLFGISEEEVICEYTRDIEARTWIVRHSFPSNSLTKHFLTRYSSRFLTIGYDIPSKESRNVTGSGEYRKDELIIAPRLRMSTILPVR
ncbi:hypothetical protein DICVIV_00003 [Dictyocaulus viviparus]|uniref:Uncharacterized protein n=1 Tax=Dictyocaulus viviparus TaxID=29172 RepID=A0A0D8Y9Z6_DICVI|nr:hypothetical protein DICVIV_00003 [Dictyocaulus viviparus]